MPTEKSRFSPLHRTIYRDLSALAFNYFILNSVKSTLKKLSQKLLKLQIGFNLTLFFYIYRLKEGGYMLDIM